MGLTMQLLKHGGLALDTANEINSRNFSKIRHFCFQSTNYYLTLKTCATIRQKTTR